MLIFFSCYQLANMVEGRIQQTFDSDGNLFLDEDPKVVHLHTSLGIINNKGKTFIICLICKLVQNFSKQYLKGTVSREKLFN